MSKQNNPAAEIPKVKTSSKLVVTFGLAIILTLFLGGGVWAYFVNLSGAVIAPGQVAVLGKPKTIQHLDGGIVSQINVDNGDDVDKGDVLVKLDETLLQANLNIYQNRLRESLARKARLLAERDNSQFIDWDDEVLIVLGFKTKESVHEGQQRLFEARRNTINGQTSQFKEKIKQFENQVNGTTALKNSNVAQLEFLDQELAGIRDLASQSLSPKSQLMALERQRQGLIGQIAEQDAEIARISNSITETEIQILQIDREFRQSVLEELRQIEQEVSDMTQQLYATIEQLKRIEIKAPVSGVVHELSVFTIGGVIGPGGPVLQIIPQTEEFDFEAKVDPQFVDELFKGQEASLRFSAFNQRTTPELKGNVSHISPNAILDDRTGLSYYLVYFDIEHSELEKLNGQNLISGMPIEAYIKTKDRTALNYLIKPLTDQFKRAFREE